jgi:hypothetical protein
VRQGEVVSASRPTCHSCHKCGKPRDASLVASDGCLATIRPAAREGRLGGSTAARVTRGCVPQKLSHAPLGCLHAPGQAAMASDASSRNLEIVYICLGPSDIGRPHMNIASSWPEFHDRGEYDLLLESWTRGRPVLSTRPYLGSLAGGYLPTCLCIIPSERATGYEAL